MERGPVDANAGSPKSARCGEQMIEIGLGFLAPVQRRENELRGFAVRVLPREAGEGLARTHFEQNQIRVHQLADAFHEAHRLAHLLRPVGRIGRLGVGDQRRR